MYWKKSKSITWLSTIRKLSETDSTNQLTNDTKYFQINEIQLLQCDVHSKKNYEVLQLSFVTTGNASNCKLTIHRHEKWHFSIMGPYLYSMEGYNLVDRHRDTASRPQHTLHHFYRDSRNIFFFLNITRYWKNKHTLLTVLNLVYSCTQWRAQNL